MKYKRNQTGFSLVELAIAIAIIAIITLMVLPNVDSNMSSSSINAAANELVGGFNLAKKEAIRRGYPINICPANSTYTGCDTTNWNNGVLIWQDNDLSGSYTDNYTAPEQIAMIKFTNGFTVTTTPAGTAFQFDSKGNLSQSILFCLADRGNYKQVTINPLGVVSSCTTTDSSCNNCQ